MSNKHLELVYAYRKNKLVHISEVETGLKCNCICKTCGKRLIAKNSEGNIKIKHFAHYDETNCTGNPETLLHCKAKEIIAKTKNVLFPGVSIKYADPIDNIVLEQEKLHRVTSSKIEVDLDDIRPDILLKIDEELFIVEIYVTHRVNNKKLKKIIDKGISAIEIDLSKCSRHFSEQELTKELYKLENIKWLFHKKLPLLKKRYFELHNELKKSYSECEIEFELEEKFVIKDCRKIELGLINTASVDPLKECPLCKYYLGLVPGKASIICAGKHEKSIDEAILEFYQSIDGIRVR